MISGNLPNDVMMEIFTRLPAKSLMRFKCVCKSWYAFFEDLDFVIKHYEARARITQNNCIIIVDFVEKKQPCKSTYDPLLSLLYDDPLNGIRHVDLDLPFSLKKKTNIHVYGHGGLFCLTYWQKHIHNIVLWNPAIREFKALPFSHDPELPPYTHVVRREIGFGFDSKTNNYKVVKIWTFQNCEAEVTYRVEVCNLNDKSWRQVDAAPPVKLSAVCEYQLYLKGKYYWECLKKLISFDFAHEDFQAIQLPDIHAIAKMTTLKGSIALITRPAPMYGRDIEIWLMTEYNDHVSWAKYLSIDRPLQSLDGLHGFWKNGQLIYFEDDRETLMSLDLSTRESKDLEQKLHDYHHWIMAYNECLVSFKEGNGVELPETVTLNC